VVYRLFSGDPSDAIYEEFQRGGLDDSPLPVKNYRAAVADSRWVYVKRPMFSVRFYGFNTRVKPLDDRRVRQALITRWTACSSSRSCPTAASPRRGVIPPGTLGFNPKLAGLCVRSARARELLARPGTRTDAACPRSRSGPA
jgi:hypothetical protein